MNMTVPILGKTRKELVQEYVVVYRNPPPSGMTKTQLRGALDAHYFFMRWAKVCTSKPAEDG